jgi:hypothetical protein
MRRQAAASVIASTLFVAVAAPLRAQPQERRFRVTPLVGLGVWGDYYQGPVLFSDGDRDFLEIEPDAGVTVGLQLSYYLTERLAVYVGATYASPDADYVEDRNVRPDIELKTLDVDLGVLFDVARFGSVTPSTFALGGGLSVVSHSPEGMVWDGERIEPTTTSLGVHGLGALDLGLTALLALRVQLELGVVALRLDDLEEALAFADNEAAADLDSEAVTYAQASIGLTLRF